MGTSEPWIDPETPPWQFIFQDQFLKFFAFSDPNYNSLSFDINSSDLTKAQAVIHRAGAAATNPDLSAFRDHGGRLILYHSWSDPAVTPLETVDYYDSMARKTGRGYHDTQEFARLFMAPGMRHCIGTGPGPNVFDPLAPMISWVENKSAPDRIVATHYKDNEPNYRDRYAYDASLSLSQDGKVSRRQCEQRQQLGLSWRALTVGSTKICFVCWRLICHSLALYTGRYG